MKIQRDNANTPVELGRFAEALPSVLMAGYSGATTPAPSLSLLGSPADR